MDSGSLFGNFLQLAASWFGRGKSSVIKQTLEIQSEDTSATRDPLKEACSPKGELVRTDLAKLKRSAEMRFVSVRRRSPVGRPIATR